MLKVPEPKKRTYILADPLPNPHAIHRTRLEELYGMIIKVFHKVAVDGREVDTWGERRNGEFARGGARGCIVCGRFGGFHGVGVEMEFEPGI